MRAERGSSFIPHPSSLKLSLRAFRLRAEAFLELFQRSVKLFLDTVIDTGFLVVAHLLQERALAVLEELHQLRLELADIFYRNIVGVTVRRCPDANYLFLD